MNIIKKVSKNKFFKPKTITVRTLSEQIERDHFIALEMNSNLSKVKTLAPAPVVKDYVYPNWYTNKFNGFLKVDRVLKGGIITIILFNPTTKAIIKVDVDDLQYQDKNTNSNLTIAQLEQLDYDIPRVECNEYNIFTQKKEIGLKFKIVKGIKFPIGTTGVIEKFDYFKKNGRVLTTYVVFNNGLKVDVSNIEII